MADLLKQCTLVWVVQHLHHCSLSHLSHPSLPMAHIVLLPGHGQVVHQAQVLATRPAMSQMMLLSPQQVKFLGIFEQQDQSLQWLGASSMHKAPSKHRLVYLPNCSCPDVVLSWKYPFWPLLTSGKSLHNCTSITIYKTKLMTNKTLHTQVKYLGPLSDINKFPLQVSEMGSEMQWESGNSTMSQLPTNLRHMTSKHNRELGLAILTWGQSPALNPMMFSSSKGYVPVFYTHIWDACYSWSHIVYTIQFSPSRQSPCCWVIVKNVSVTLISLTACNIPVEIHPQPVHLRELTPSSSYFYGVS